MTYTEIAKILSEQIELLVEKCKNQVGNPHNAYFINLCSEIDETAKTLTCALPHNAAIQSHETLSKVIDTLDNLVCLIKKESSEMLLNSKRTGGALPPHISPKARKRTEGALNENKPFYQSCVE